MRKSNSKNKRRTPAHNLIMFAVVAAVAGMVVKCHASDVAANTDASTGSTGSTVVIDANGMLMIPEDVVQHTTSAITSDSDSADREDPLSSLSSLGVHVRVVEEQAEEDKNDHDNDNEDDDDVYTFEFQVPDSYQDLHSECGQWASEGECNINPALMLTECIPSCISHPAVQQSGLLQWGVFVFPSANGNGNTASSSSSSSFDPDCVDAHTINVERGLVVEEHEGQNCQTWAEDGLCISPLDKPFMLHHCRKSCMVCLSIGGGPNQENVDKDHENDEDDEDEDDDDDEEDVFELGMGQLIPKELLPQTLNILIETSKYMTQHVMNTQNELYHSSRKACKNKDALCAVWGAEGKCHPSNEDYDWMVMNCAPVCQTCELLDVEIRCPIPEDAVDAFQPNINTNGNINGGEFGLNAMFERIVGERDLTLAQLKGGMGGDRDRDRTAEEVRKNVDIFSRPGGDETNADIIDGPWVISISNFLTDEECEYLIHVGEVLGYERSSETSTLRDGSAEEDHVSDTRTSTNAWCNDDIPEHSAWTAPCKDQPVVKQVKEKMALFTTVPADNSEDLQLLHYEPGQYYRVHHDYIEAYATLPAGPRILTFFLYLNDVEEGGGTRFPELAHDAPPVTVQPAKGKALLWPSVLDEDPNERDDWTMHEALPVLKGRKYAANSWLHLRDEQNVEGIECG